jgi:hypothetical protein
MPDVGSPYEAKKKLPVPAVAAWNILTCQAGARRWLADDAHPGIRALVPAARDGDFVLVNMFRGQVGAPSILATEFAVDGAAR